MEKASDPGGVWRRSRKFKEELVGVGSGRTSHRKIRISEGPALLVGRVHRAVRNTENRPVSIPRNS
eukprot:4842972-Amphidinium_carterae.2